MPMKNINNYKNEIIILIVVSLIILFASVLFLEKNNKKINDCVL